jgi:hypothetical protein
MINRLQQTGRSAFPSNARCRPHVQFLKISEYRKWMRRPSKGRKRFSYLNQCVRRLNETFDLLDFECRLQAYQEWAFNQRLGNRANEKVTVPASIVGRDTAKGQNPPRRSPTKISGGFLLSLIPMGETMKSAFHSFGSSPTGSKSRPITRPDFSFQYHGSICLLTPLTHAAKDWFSAHLPMISAANLTLQEVNNAPI